MNVEWWNTIYLTCPSLFPKTELRMKSGGANVSTRATASGFNILHSSIIPSRRNCPPSPEIYPP